MKKQTRKFKVRFHLGKGENFMHWRIEDTDTGQVEFYDPDKYELTMLGCKLYNQVGGATKIYKRETDKTVVAWVQCEAAIPLPKNCWNHLSTRVFYNPHVCPHWKHEGKIVDKHEYERLHTAGNQIFKPMEV